jgi:AcrR family transcriptional regulator
MGVQERRAREKKELRQEILDAARDLFVHEGYENVSMRKIADKIEYSPTTIYLYFQDKADLLDCVCEETMSRLVRKQMLHDQTIADPLERLRRSLRSYIEFGLKHPNHYKVTFMMLQPVAENANCRSREMGKRAFHHLQTTLAQCVEQHLLEVGDIQTSSQALWATIHGVTSLLITHQKFPWVDRDQLIDTVIETAIAGMQSGVVAQVPDLRPR